MAEMSTVDISKRENTLLKSRGKANELCSLICAHRLLDVLVSFDLTEESTMRTTHKQMGFNMSKNDVRIYLYLCKLLYFLTINRSRCGLSRTGRQFYRNFSRIILIQYKNQSQMLRLRIYPQINYMPCFNFIPT
jgi:hypothetical protein